MKQCMDSENLHRRLKKIIGQVQAIDRMIDEDVPCRFSESMHCFIPSAPYDLIVHMTISRPCFVKAGARGG